MGRSRFARSSRLIAFLLVVVSLSALPHRQQDDAACRPVAAEEHDHSRHALAPLGAVEHEHCAICHWARGVKPGCSSAAAVPAPADASSGVAAQPTTGWAVTAADPLAARAPPSLQTL